MSVPELPDDLTGALSQAAGAVQAALAAGYTRLQVDILIPDLKPEQLGQPFGSVLPEPFAFLFADAGAAALALREWGQPDWVVKGVKQGQTLPPETGLIFIAPGVVQVGEVEALCDQRGSGVKSIGTTSVGAKVAPIVLVNPQLQDAATVGIGLSGRRLRQRFISTLEPCYYLQPLGAGALFRVYPHPWTVWQLDEANETYELVGTQLNKPTGEELTKLLAGSGGGLVGELKRFLRALGN